MCEQFAARGEFQHAGIGPVEARDVPPFADKGKVEHGGDAARGKPRIDRADQGFARIQTRLQLDAGTIGRCIQLQFAAPTHVRGRERAVAAVVALAAVSYVFVLAKGPAIVAANVKAPSPNAPRGRDDVVMADLKPGVDGGSSGEALPFALQRQVVFYRTTVVPGSIVVDRENRFLYLIDANNSARRYGIGIAQECLKGGSLSRVMNKMEWPDWRPSGANTKDADALLAAAGRPGSPLGARALLLDKPGLLIHGTNSPKTIGHLVASGCIRLVNDDVKDLYRRVSVETRVVFAS